MGTAKYSARFVSHLPHCLSRVCADAEHRADRRLLHFLGLVSRRLPGGRQGAQLRTWRRTRYARAVIGWSTHRRAAGARSQHRRRPIVGPCWPRRRVLLRRALRDHRQRRALDAGSSAGPPVGVCFRPKNLSTLPPPQFAVSISTRENALLASERFRMAAQLSASSLSGWCFRRGPSLAN